MQKTQTTCLVILVTIATGFSLFYLKSVLLPFVLAVFIAFGCRPMIEFMERRLGLHRFFAFVVSFFIGVILLLGFAFLIWVSINDLAKNSDVYRNRLNAIATWAVDRIPDPARKESQPEDDSGDFLVVEDSTSEQDPTAALEGFLTSISSYVQTQILRLAGSLSSLFSYGVLILIFVFLLLLGNIEVGGKPVEDNLGQAGILGDIEGQIRKYLVMKTLISLATGFTFGLVLWMFGVPLAIVFGFLAFLLNFIPNIGPLISTVLPVPFLALNSAMSPTSAIICFILIASIQFVSGNVIETRMMGQSFDVSPITLLLALMFFGLVWGIVGMFLATPIVSIVKIVLQEHESTQPIADLMAGRLDILTSRPT